MKLKYIHLCVAIFSATSLFGQIPYVNSHEVLQQGMKFHDSGEYKKAIEYYKMIPDGDTNYVQSIYEQSLSYMSDSAFRECINITKYGLSIPRNPIKAKLMLNLAAVYDYIGRQDSAIMIYDSLIVLYPLSNQPYYEKGVLCFRKKEYDAAAYYFQQSLLYNPFHFNSSYVLSLVYALQGRLSEAIIVAEGALYHTTDTDLARKVIGVLSEVSRMSEEIDQAYKNKEKKYKHPVFDEIDEIIAAKLVLNKEYKLKTDIDDKITRQTQAILEKLTYKEKDTNFVMQYYVPLLVRINKEDLFGPYVLNLLSGYGIEQVENELKKNKRDLKEISAIINDYTYKLYSTRTLNYTARQSATPRYYYYDLRTIIDANLKDRDKMLFGEGTMKVYEDHLLSVSGAYNKEGKRTGKWLRYYDNGVLKSETIYKDDVEFGELKEYARSGALRSVYVYGSDGKVKEERSYTKEGILDYVQKLTAGGDLEYISYYAAGNTEVKLNVRKNEVMDGTYTYYYNNGAVKKIATWKNGTMHGPLKEYFDNGKVSIEGVVEKGEKEGIFTEYFDNGSMDSKYTYKKGIANGPYEEYLEDGTIVSTGTYLDGKLNGTQKNYNRYGQLYSTIVFDKEKPTSIKYTLPDGTPVYQKEDSKGILQYEHYFSNGNKKSSITLNSQGDAEGILSFYNYTGSLWQTRNYKAGKLDGMRTSYYKNGQKSEEANFKDDVMDGYYKEYYTNGIVRKEGWYKDDKRQGLWKFYGANGKIEDEHYYIDDELNGYIKGYNINGELRYKEIYEDGMLTGAIQYDTAGQIYAREYFPLTSCTYTLKTADNRQYYSVGINYGMLHGKLYKTYPNGNVREVGQYLFGRKDSVFTSYHANGNISSTGQYKNDKREGEWKFYNEIGELKMSQEYRDGDEEGLLKVYAGTGLRYLDSFHNGNKEGKQYVYGDAGKLAGVLIFESGDLVSYTYEGADGKLVPEIKLVNGTGEVNTMYANGKKALAFIMKENLYNGIQKVYYSNGQLAEERNFSGNIIDGAYKRYYSDGKPQYEATLKNDALHGSQKYFDETGAVLIHNNYYYGHLHGVATITDPKTKKTVTETYRYGMLQ